MLIVYSLWKTFQTLAYFLKKYSLFIWCFYLVINERKREIEYAF